MAPHRHRLTLCALALALVGADAGAAAPRLSPALAMLAAEPAPKKDAGLGPHIDALLEDKVFADAQIGISVFDLGANKKLYSRGDDLPLNPASNVKLVTTAAALVLLGPEHRYPTQLLRKDGALRGTTIKGDVYLRGSGDPQLVTENLHVLVSRLRARGIRKITGGIVVDAGKFDQDELPPGFDQKNELASYRAPSGATSVNFNTFIVRAAPGANVGDAGLTGVDPPVKSIAFTNATKTVAGRKRKLYADLEYEESGIKLTLRGEIGVDASPGRYIYPVDDPSRHGGEVLAYALRRAGIKLGRSKIKKGTVPKDARVLATHFSPPVGMLIRPINKFSNNFMAEQLLKTLSAPGSPATFASALARVREAMTGLGIDLTGSKSGNGSGLYDTNRYTPAQLTQVLAKMYADFRYRSEFVASLSVMGIDGTTSSRLADSEAERWIRVKTGTLDGISALSGYVGAPGRKPIVISVLFNDLPKGGTAKAREVQNQIAYLVSRHAAGEPLQLHDPDASP